MSKRNRTKRNRYDQEPSISQADIDELVRARRKRGFWWFLVFLFNVFVTPEIYFMVTEVKPELANNLVALIVYMFSMVVLVFIVVGLWSKPATRYTGYGKPCPNCGGKGYYHKGVYATNLVEVYCSKCGEHLHTGIR